MQETFFELMRCTANSSLFQRKDKKIEKYFAHIKKSTTFAPVIERQRYTIGM